MSRGSRTELFKHEQRACLYVAVKLTLSQESSTEPASVSDMPGITGKNKNLGNIPK